MVDLTSHRILSAECQDERIRTSFAAFGNHGKSLAIVAIDLPRGAPLVEVTCALGRELDLSIDQTLIVVTSVGLHAYSGGLSYHQIRTLARRYNPQARTQPLAASTMFAASVLRATLESEQTRDQLGISGVLLFSAGLAMLLVLRRRS